MGGGEESEEQIKQKNITIVKLESNTWKSMR